MNFLVHAVSEALKQVETLPPARGADRIREVIKMLEKYEQDLRTSLPPDEISKHMHSPMGSERQGSDCTHTTHSTHSTTKIEKV